MKNILSINYTNFSCFVLLLLLVNSQSLIGQSISATNTGTAPSGFSLYGNLPSGWTSSSFLPATNSASLARTVFSVNSTNYTGLNSWGCNGGNPPNNHNLWVAGQFTSKMVTTITGLTVGKTYTVSFYVAEFPDGGYTGTETETLGVFMENSLVHTYSPNSLCSWGLTAFNFTASSASMNISFGFIGDRISNPIFWNISFSSNAVKIATVDCYVGEETPTIN